MVLNQQKSALNLVALRAFVRRIRRTLRLGKRDFNVCFVDDRTITRLNRAYLGGSRPTDVLSFPWQGADSASGNRTGGRELKNFLGDVVISVERARRNARFEGHSTLNEIRWLVLHGVLHLLGYDHETDEGQMTPLELALRERLGIAGSGGKQRPAKQARPLHG